MIALVLASLLAADAAPSCSVACEQERAACERACRREHRAKPFHPEDDRGGATPHLTCPEACDFDAGACEATCPEEASRAGS